MPIVIQRDNSTSGRDLGPCFPWPIGCMIPDESKFHSWIKQEADEDAEFMRAENGSRRRVRFTLRVNDRAPLISSPMLIFLYALGEPLFIQLRFSGSMGPGFPGRSFRPPNTGREGR